MNTNNLFCNARIQLKDGSILNEKDPHVLRSILHQQLHTREHRFRVQPTQRRQKATRPDHHTRASIKRDKVMRHFTGETTNLPIVVEQPKKVEKMEEVTSSMDNLIRYH